MEWIFITLYLTSPFVISAIMFFLLSKTKNTHLDTPINFSQLWFKLLGSNYSPRKLLIFFVIIFPFIFLSTTISIIPRYMVWIIFLGSIIFSVFNNKSLIDDQSQRTLNNINDISSSLSALGLNLAHLTNLITNKQLEIERNEKINVELDKQIRNKTDEFRFLEDLTDEQKRVISRIIRNTQKPTIFSTAGIILGTVSLNLVATIIWTLLGNPGKEVLTNQMTTISHIFSK